MMSLWAFSYIIRKVGVNHRNTSLLKKLLARGYTFRIVYRKEKTPEIISSMEKEFSLGQYLLENNGEDTEDLSFVESEDIVL
jgi:adenylyl- and sulfurtransferase ThiI